MHSAACSGRTRGRKCIPVSITYKDSHLCKLRVAKVAGCTTASLLFINLNYPASFSSNITEVLVIGVSETGAITNCVFESALSPLSSLFSFFFSTLCAWGGWGWGVFLTVRLKQAYPGSEGVLWLEQSTRKLIYVSMGHIILLNRQGMSQART